MNLACASSVQIKFLARWEKVVARILASLCAIWKIDVYFKFRNFSKVLLYISREAHHEYLRQFSGTFGRVLECWDRKNREYVAIKIVRNVQKYRDAAMIEVCLGYHDMHTSAVQCKCFQALCVLPPSIG